MLAERLVVFIFLIGDFYYDTLISQNSSILHPGELLQRAIYPMWIWVLLIFTSGSRLIYRKDSGDANQLKLSNHPFLWFFLFYTPYLGFAFLLDVWFLFFGNGKGMGLLLFLLKLAVVLYLGLALHKMPLASIASESRQDEVREKASSGDTSGVLGVAGMIVLLTVDVFFITPNTPLQELIGILELIIMMFILFQPQSKM